MDDLKSQCDAISRIIRPDSIPDMKIKFGKYKNFTLKYIGEIDIDYLYFLLTLENISNKMRQNIDTILDYLED